MLKTLLQFMLVVSLLVPAFAFAENPREEAREHPRIATAIRELEEAIRYLEAAPHDFGGHKAEALEASRRAVSELRKALAYRAHEDNKRERR